MLSGGFLRLEWDETCLYYYQLIKLTYKIQFFVFNNQYIRKKGIRGKEKELCFCVREKERERGKRKKQKFN